MLLFIMVQEKFWQRKFHIVIRCYNVIQCSLLMHSYFSVYYTTTSERWRFSLFHHTGVRCDLQLAAVSPKLQLSPKEIIVSVNLSEVPVQHRLHVLEIKPPFLSSQLSSPIFYYRETLGSVEAQSTPSPTPSHNMGDWREVLLMKPGSIKLYSTEAGGSRSFLPPSELNLRTTKLRASSSFLAAPFMESKSTAFKNNLKSTLIWVA